MKFLKTKETDSFPFISMTDIVFLLLIFFMVTTQFIKNEQKIEIQLPKAQGKSSKIAKARTYTIAVAKDGKIFLNTKEVSLTQLKNVLMRDKYIEGKVAILRIDKRAVFQRVAQVLSIVKEANFSSLNILVTK